MDTKVSQAMHSGVEWVAPDTSLSEVAKLMKTKDIGSVPVGDNDRLVGMVTDRDIALRGFETGKNAAALTAGDIMTKPIIYCRADDAIEDALRIMESRQIRRLPVLNRDKRLVGIIAIADLATNEDPELVGEAVSGISEPAAGR